MPEPNNGRPMNEESAGGAMAAEMLRQIVLLNENIKKSHEIQERVADTLADLADYHETYMRAAEILIEKSDEGKHKFSGRDFVLALAEAAEEVMGEGEDEPGEEDPLVDAPRRR